MTSTSKYGRTTAICTFCVTEHRLNKESGVWSPSGRLGDRQPDAEPCRLHPARHRAMLWTMRAIGYVRVSTDKQADHGVSLEAQEAKIRAMAVVQGGRDHRSDRGRRRVGEESEQAGMERPLGLVDQGKVQSVIIAKLDRLTRSVEGQRL